MVARVQTSQRGPTSRASRRQPYRPSPTPLLLASGLTEAEVETLLFPYGFQDIKRADDNLQAMAGEPRSRERLAAILGEVLGSASETADPDQALNHWERFLQEGVNRVQLFDYFHGSPRMLHLLCTVFGNSPAMAQTLIRDPILVYWLAEEHVLTKRSSRAALARSLDAIVGNLTTSDLKLEALRRFRRREMLRIGIRDLLRIADVQESIEALSDLAAVLIQSAYQIVDADLRKRFGTPRHKKRSGHWMETGFAVIAMGKLGGGELNYSSDVDLIYVYGEEGYTTGVTRAGAVRSDSIPNEEYFEYLARELTRALSDVTQEGYVFRVDLRLRAEGSAGRLVRSLREYDRYYRARGQGWERMALLKAWPIAGSGATGRAFLRLCRPFVLQDCSSPAAESGRRSVIQEVKAVKAMIDDRMSERRQQQRNVKLGVGGIRELEFVVQTLQVLCGARLPDICDRSTLGSLERFRRHGLLTRREQAALTRSYLFLRDVEHKLQMVHDLQTHALPEDPEELGRCAIRLGYEGPRWSAAERFVAAYRGHTSEVHRLFRCLVETPERCAMLQTALRRCGSRNRPANRKAHK